MQKTRVPPSGNKHDFFSLAPYWWPDPAKPNGLPYIRRDGQVNPDSRLDVDDRLFDQMHTSVTTLARAYQSTREDRFAARAALLRRDVPSDWTTDTRDLIAIVDFHRDAVDDPGLARSAEGLVKREVGFEMDVIVGHRPLGRDGSRSLGVGLTRSQQQAGAGAEQRPPES